MVKAKSSATTGSTAAGTTVPPPPPPTAQSGANLGFEAKLWLTADTATRASANCNRAATWRDLRLAPDHRSHRSPSAT